MSLFSKIPVTEVEVGTVVREDGRYAVVTFAVIGTAADVAIFTLNFAGDPEVHHYDEHARFDAWQPSQRWPDGGQRAHDDLLPDLKELCLAEQLLDRLDIRRDELVRDHVRQAATHIEMGIGYTADALIAVARHAAEAGTV